MAGVVPVCNGNVTEDLSGLLHCDVAWQVIASPAFFDLTQIDPAVMSKAIGAGFIIGGSALGFAWGCRQLYNFIMGK